MLIAFPIHCWHQDLISHEFECPWCVRLLHPKYRPSSRIILDHPKSIIFLLHPPWQVLDIINAALSSFRTSTKTLHNTVNFSINHFQHFSQGSITNTDPITIPVLVDLHACLQRSPPSYPSRTSPWQRHIYDLDVMRRAYIFTTSNYVIRGIIHFFYSRLDYYPVYLTSHLSQEIWAHFDIVRKGGTYRLRFRDIGTQSSYSLLRQAKISRRGTWEHSNWQHLTSLSEPMTRGWWMRWKAPRTCSL